MRGANRQRSLRKARFVGALAIVTLVLSAGPASATNWRSAQAITLPAGSVGLDQGQFTTLSCPRATTCSATGLYTSTSGATASFAVDEVKGRWHTPVVLSAPAGAAGAANLSVYAMSCGAPGNCEAVGNYTDPSQNVWPMAAAEHNGVWQRAVRISLPPGAPKSEVGSMMRDVSCASAGNCSGVGTYYDSSPQYPHTLAFGVSEVNGVWQEAKTLTLPPNANTNALVTLNQLSCARVGQCVVVGSYITSNNVTTAIAINETNGAWRTARAIVPPGNASAYSGATLSALDCVSASACEAVGTYNTTQGAVATMVVTESGGHWQSARHLLSPTNAGGNPRSFFYGFHALSCANATNCALGGQYVDSSGNSQGFLAVETAGHWARATMMPLPSGSTMAGHNGGVVSVSCPSPGHCRAGGAYLDAQSNYQALLLSTSQAGWTGTPLKLPGTATTVGVDGGLYALTCPRTGPCTAIGSYLAGSSRYLPFRVIFS